MKKTIKILLALLAAVFTVVVTSSFISAVQEDSICIESVDDVQLGFYVSSSQIEGLSSLLPEEYRKMLDDSYKRFRYRFTSTGYDRTFIVEGVRFSCNHTENMDIFTIWGEFQGFGHHKIRVKVPVREKFIAQMDEAILNGK